MTRDELIETAAQVFRQKGYHGASMEDLAQATRLKKASLYHHFTSKQEILLEILDRALQLLLEKISAITSQNIPADKKLRLMIRQYMQILSENVDLAAVLLFEHRALDRRQHMRHIPNRDKFESLWREVIEEGVHKKIFRFDDPPMAVRALLGQMNWTITWYSPEGDKSIEQIADDYSNLLLHGLLK
jgi:TetR/AcrR family transcriptional regulator, cholesterol catabolism regulator